MPRRDAARGAARDGDYVPLAEQDPALWDTAADRRGRGAAVARERDGRDRPLSAGGGGAIGPCGPPADRPLRLGGDRAALRRPFGDHRFAGGGDQPGDRPCRDARPDAGLGALEALADDARLADTSPIGRRAPRFWRARATSTRPTRPTNGRSAWNPTRRSAASCSNAAQSSSPSPSGLRIRPAAGPARDL